MCTLNLNSCPNNIRRGQWALVHGYHEVPCWDWHWPSSDLPANFLDFVFTSITFISCLTPISVWVRKSIWTPQIELLKPLLREWQPFGQNHCMYHHIFCQPCFLLPYRVGTFKTETMSLHFSSLWYLPFNPRGWGIYTCCTLCWVNEEDMACTSHRA